ncbi:MAG: universal stress protein [Anaerolineales bacterium]|nr:universal stress protein [Anaerolineales bacterium]
MPGIVCAIRGGPASRPTIEKSIQLAVETHSPLYFLYVVNLDFLSRTTCSRVHLLSKQMHEMGEFILLVAQAEAQAQGIKTEGIVRQGNVRDEIVALCQETNADYVILGRPKTHSEEENVFTHERLDKFTQRIKEESGAKIIMADV